MTATGIPRRRHRSLRAPPHRRLAGPLIDIVAAPETTGITGAPTARAHRRLDQHRHGRRRRPHRAAYPGLAAAARGLGDAADPASRNPRRQSRAALALLVFSQSAFRLPQEGRLGLSGPRRQSSLRRRLRSRPLRRAASFHAWRPRCSPMTRRSSPTSRSGLSIPDVLGDGANAAGDHALLPGEIINGIELPQPLQASARSTSARSAAPMRNGRWSRSARALW